MCVDWYQIHSAFLAAQVSGLELGLRESILSTQGWEILYSLNPQLREVHSFNLGSIDSVHYWPWVERYCVKFLDPGSRDLTQDLGYTPWTLMTFIFFSNQLPYVWASASVCERLCPLRASVSACVLLHPHSCVCVCIRVCASAFVCVPIIKRLDVWLGLSVTQGKWCQQRSLAQWFSHIQTTTFCTILSTLLSHIGVQLP